MSRSRRARVAADVRRYGEEMRYQLDDPWNGYATVQNYPHLVVCRTCRVAPYLASRLAVDHICTRHRCMSISSHPMLSQWLYDVSRPGLFPRP